MIAAVTPRAYEVAAELAPLGVEVLRLPEGRERAAFVLPDWHDRDTFRALPRLERLRVLQVLSAGTDGIESRVPPWATPTASLPPHTAAGGPTRSRASSRAAAC